MVKVKVIWLLWCPDYKNLLRPADGALARDDVTFAVIEAEVGLNLAHALTRQTVHAQVSGVAHTLSLARPPVDHAPGELVTGLELTRVGPVTCPQNHSRRRSGRFRQRPERRRRVHDTGTAEGLFRKLSTFTQVLKSRLFKSLHIFIRKF